MNCCRWCYPGLGILPITFATVTTLTFISTYMISVSNDHVYKYFPTISDTGGKKPESNIFGFLLSGSSFVGLIVVWIRYVQYNHLSEYNEEDTSRYLILNKVALVVGAIACIGALMVANFQDRGVSSGAHAAGALGVFGGGIVYAWLQTALSFKMLRVGMYKRKICVTRLVFSILSLMCIIAFFILFYYANKAWDKNPPNHGFSLWQPGDPGYKTHVASSVMEWCCAVSLMLFFLTFTGEFNEIQFGCRVYRVNMRTLPFYTSIDYERLPDA